MNVLGHVQDLDWQLREIATVIKLGGRLVVVSPNRAFDWFNAPKHWVTGYRSDPTIKYLFTARSMHRLLAIHGFERRRLKYVGSKLAGLLPIYPWFVAVWEKVPD